MSDLKTRIMKAIKYPKYAFLRLVTGNHFEWMSDEDFLKMLFQVHMDKKLDLDNPKTFNEKLQWLKFHDRKPEYTTMVDKYAVKKYVADIIGEEYIIPTLGKWDHFDDIDFDALPNQFVLKCNHDSGSIVIVRDKSKLDKVAAKKKIERGLKRNGFWYAREWPYKNVKPCIIAEKYLEDNNLTEYKFYCFNEIMKYVSVCKGPVHAEYGARTNDTFDMDFNHIEWHTISYPNSIEPIAKPRKFDELKKLCEKLCKGHTNIRVDFYIGNGKIYFGELTFFEEAGFAKFDPAEWDEKLGKLITLPDKKWGGYAVICNGFIIWVHQEQEKRADGMLDYKWFCFDGEPKIMYISNDKGSDPRTDFFDMDFNFLDVHMKDPNSDVLPCKPACFEKMKELARKLSKGILHVRVDFYYVNGKIYFGELTFYHGGGFSLVRPDEWNVKLGEWISLVRS